MEKKADPELFVNDGSFMEKFKQLQQEQQANKATSNDAKSATSSSVKPVTIIPNKRPFEIKASNGNKDSPSLSGGKLAFSLKSKSKVVAPAVKLSEDEDEEREDFDKGSDESAKRQKLVAPDLSRQSSQPRGVAAAAAPPSDPAVKIAADKLASFVAKNGRNFEHVTRQKNPGDTAFKFLYDPRSSDYKYYEYRLLEEEKALAKAKAHETATFATSTADFKSQRLSQRNPSQPRSNYQTPASALYDVSEETSSYSSNGGSAYDESSGHSSSDPIAMMEFYMKKAAQEERKRPPRKSKDEMPPPASLQVTEKKGHHMGDYIPPEELEKFLASCNDVAAQKAAQEAAEKAKIQADNIGHKLLSKMGWREGEGLGSDKSGRADPVMAGGIKTNNLGVGASQPGEVTSEDDIYEQYKKRMMLGYRYRPNPLNNPRKSYY